MTRLIALLTLWWLAAMFAHVSTHVFGNHFWPQTPAEVHADGLKVRGQPAPR